MWQPHRDSELLSQHRRYARGHKQKVLANCVPLAVLAYASPGTFMTLRRRFAELAAKQPLTGPPRLSKGSAHCESVG